MLDRRSFLKFLAALSGGIWGIKSPLHTATATQQFVIPPNILHVTDTTANLYFRLAYPTKEGLVRLSSGGEVIQEIPFATEDILRIQMILENLQPATTYQYQVLVEGNELFLLNDVDPWNNLEFTTPPFEFPLRVAAIGDTGFGEKITFDLAEKLASHEPDVFFHLGDVIYFMNEFDNDHFVNWQKKYFHPFKSLLRRMPHYPTFGNHDLDKPTFLDGIPSYYWIFPPINEDQHNDQRMWYSFDLNGIQFISLNSQLFYSYPDLRNEQEAWLDTKLARTDVLYTVVFCHIPPFTSSSPHQWDGVYVAEQWSPKFEAAKVPLVINGHAHVYEHLKQNGVHYITAGAGSNAIYGEGQRVPQTITLWSLASYPIFDFYPDHIHITIYTLDDQILDEIDVPIAN